MNAFDRIEPQLPQLMAELAPAQVPDYFDDMLRQSARSRQRPAWSALERWLPMGVIARTAPVRQVPWRPILVVALVMLLATAALVLISGSRTHRLPAPFGLAGNGVIATSVNGDIATVDPATGRTTVIIAGPATDTDPMFMNRGDRILFTRTDSGAAPALFIADADGSNVRQLIGGDTPIAWADWTANGDRIIYTSVVGDVATTAILDVATGTSKKIDVGTAIDAAGWRPAHDEFVFFSSVGTPGFYLAAGDGSSARPIAFPDGATVQWQLSPDGSKLVYMQWADGPGLQGRLRTIDIDTGQDRLLTPVGDGYTWANPQLSPDGKLILAERFVGTTGPGVTHLALLPADGNGPAVEVGRGYDAGTGSAHAQFSPDGTKILAFYQDDGSSWMLDATGGPGRRLDWSYTVGPAWQRVATAP